MKKLLLIMICWPLVSTAQNGITLSGLVVNGGTVTVDISWEMPMPMAVWSDTVWVFADYNAAGVMKRLPLLPGATLTATLVPGIGKAVEEPGNNKGVWVVGNARSAGHFSATVSLLTSIPDAPGVCVYASNYRPEGTYNSPTNIAFTGTPMYDVVLEHTDGSTVTVQSNKVYLMPASYTVVSFTDATGAPGVLGCIPMSGNLDFSVPASVAKKQQASFVITAQPTAANLPVTYNWQAPDFDPSIQIGSTSTFTATAPADFGTYPVAVTARAKGYCDVTRKKEVTLGNCINPVVQNLSVSALGFCAGAEGVVFTMDDTQNGVPYQLYKDGVAVGTVLNGVGGPATFAGTFDVGGTYTARVVNGAYCGTLMDGTLEITANAAGQIGTGGAVCGSGAGRIGR